MEVTIKNHDEISAEVAAQIMTLLFCQWPQFFPKEIRTLGWSTNAAYPIEHVIVSENGVVTAHAAISQQQISASGHNYPIYGLGMVVTSPPFRGEGYGTEVVAAATRHIDRAGIAGLLFCSSELEHFYARHGWQRVEAPILYGDPGNPDRLEGESVMLLAQEDYIIKQFSSPEPIYVGVMTW